MSLENVKSFVEEVQVVASDKDGQNVEIDEG